MWSFIGLGGLRASRQNQVSLLKKGPAFRVIFYYPGEEGTYVENVYVRLYENGIVHIRSEKEESTTHLQNCEILWSYKMKPKAEAPGLKSTRETRLRLLKTEK